MLAILSLSLSLCFLSLLSPIKATIKCIEAPPERFTTDGRVYNIQAVSFTPGELVEEMKKHVDDFVVEYRPDERQAIGGCSLGRLVGGA